MMYVHIHSNDLRNFLQKIDIDLHNLSIQLNLKKTPRKRNWHCCSKLIAGLESACLRTSRDMMWLDFNGSIYYPPSGVRI